MYNLFTAQYWRWISLFPEFILGMTGEPATDTGDVTSRATGWACMKAPVTSRKPLRRALRYDHARKHL
ncbi:hypothetical protein ABH945_007130 [Paraburkholderia sp. GAS333]